MTDRAPDSQENGLDFVISEDLVQSPQHKAPETGSLSFDGLLQPALKLHQDLANGNGGQAWPAGMVLARYLLRRKRDELKDASILELGAGGGLVGLAIALGCRPNKTLHITDQSSMLELMQQNIALNLLEDSVAASVLDWGSSSSQLHLVPGSSSTSSGHPDVILAADCVYFEPAFPLLQQTLRDLVGPNTCVYFCFKRRRRADLHFMAKVRKQFNVEEIVDDPHKEVYARENIFLYAIRTKGA